MAASKRLIVGLGNPGSAYDKTRHNIGFEVVEAIADRIKEPFTTKGQSRIAWGSWRGRPLGVCMPQTFMNRSGLAVEEIVRKSDLKPEDILVIVDDIHLDTGVIRIRGNGGTGGHNGMEDIADWLDTNQFPRLRIGVGNNYGRGQQAQYVLEPFTEEERLLIDPAIEKARDAALTFVTDGIVTSMNRYNG
ncbi:aminoacyl-tRNA hydrolase [bacterium]|nr:aminoacyl-tRNA hydrolase [bacterium]